jgi:hypothetical protein
MRDSGSSASSNSRVVRTGSAHRHGCAARPRRTRRRVQQVGMEGLLRWRVSNQVERQHAVSPRARRQLQVPDPAAKRTAQRVVRRNATRATTRRRPRPPSASSTWSGGLTGLGAQFLTCRVRCRVRDHRARRPVRAGRQLLGQSGSAISNARAASLLTSNRTSSVLRREAPARRLSRPGPHGKIHRRQMPAPEESSMVLSRASVLTRRPPDLSRCVYRPRAS